MRVGKLLNKEVKDIPGIKNPYKVERCMSKEKRREIEQNLLMKKYYFAKTRMYIWWG